MAVAALCDEEAENVPNISYVESNKQTHYPQPKRSSSISVRLGSTNGEEAQYEDVDAAGGNFGPPSPSLLEQQLLLPLLRILLRNRDLHLSDTDDVTLPPHDRLANR